MLVSVGGLATTASAEQPDVQVTVAYDKATYNSDDSMTVTLTITNNSDEELENVQVFNRDPCLANVFGWPELGFVVTVPAHGTVSDTETGANPIRGGLGGTATCAGTVIGSGLDDIPFSTTATVNQVYGDFNGVLFHDVNHDGRFESGEGVDGISVQYSLSDVFDSTPQTIVSGPHGRFALSHVPVGSYFLNFSSTRNWAVDDPTFATGNGASVTVTEAAQPTAFVPVIPPLSERLKVRFGFDQATYHPGDTTHLTATLINTSGKPITGVVADCNRVGDEFALSSFEGWGLLSGNGPGATIPAHSTVTFHVDQPLPDPALRTGYVAAPCVFGPEPDDNPQVGFPGNDAKAKVPGLISNTLLQFVRSDDTTVPVAGLRVRIVDEVAGRVLTTATTDGSGEINLPTLAAGLYTLHPLGGYAIPAGQSDVLQARSPGSAPHPRSYEVTPPSA